ncbi:hypothetical protein TWF694_000694 [Orbilia ellipsospora]|uniref:Uncharacterized protein n=1 Tax=Orbilia ellipsospora TaxID=2528407 RepID=A0AAV9XPT8_9PEZI
MAAKKSRSTPSKGVVALVPDPKPKPATPQKQKKHKPKSRNSKPPPRPPPRQRTWKAQGFSLIFRSFIVYSLYQYIWTCPKDGSDPRRVCDVGDTVLDIIEPPLYDAYDTYIEPYYTEYLSSHVESLTPYVIRANEKYIQPAQAYTVGQYEKHAMPVLFQAKQGILAQYANLLEPHVKNAEAKGVVFYNAYLADLVATCQEIYDAYSPVAIGYSQQAYEYVLDLVYPYYLASLPYIEKAWTEGIATAGWAGVEGKGWVARRWGMHVEPQLWRIQERLGMKGLKHATPVKEAGPTPPHRGSPNASSSDTTPDETIEDEYDEDEDDEEPVAGADREGEPAAESPKNKKSSAEQIAEARALVEADLTSWTAKFEEGGVKASAEVVRNLNELCDKAMEDQNPKTIKLLEDLDTHISKEFKDFEGGLLNLLDSSAEYKFVMNRYDGLVGRHLGNLKAKHDQIVEQTQSFLMDTYQNTAKIVDAALADMDVLHDTGMQELGMKWAWMDGVTYKDWAKYHELKQTFGSYKTKVIRSGQSHKGLREVTDYVKSVDEAAGATLKVAEEEFEKLEKLGRKRLEDSDAAKRAGKDKHGQDTKDDQQSESPNAKEVPEPKEEKEQSTEIKMDESNHTPDQGQKKSQPEQVSEQEPEQEPEPEHAETNPESPTEQPKPEPTPETKDESAATTEERSEPESPAEETEAEAGKRETSRDPESKPKLESEEPEFPASGRSETEPKLTEDFNTKTNEEFESELELTKQESATSPKPEPNSEKAESEADIPAESADEQPSLKTEKPSTKEKVDPEDGSPLNEPVQGIDFQREKIVQKDEL